MAGKIAADTELPRRCIEHRATECEGTKRAIGCATAERCLCHSRPSQPRNACLNLAVLGETLLGQGIGMGGLGGLVGAGRLVRGGDLLAMGMTLRLSWNTWA